MRYTTVLYILETIPHWKKNHQISISIAEKHRVDKVEATVFWLRKQELPKLFLCSNQE